MNDLAAPFSGLKTVEFSFWWGTTPLLEKR